MFARDGDMVPLSLVLPDGRRSRSSRRCASRWCRPQTATRGAQDARDGHAARRHRAEGAVPGYSVARQDRHLAQVGGQGAPLRQRPPPRLVRRHGAGRQAAHRRRGDDRRAEGRQVLRRRRGRAGVQPGGAADAAHDGRAARPRRQVADRRARHARSSRRATDGAAAPGRRARCQRLAGAARRACAGHRQPARAGRAMPSSPGPAMRWTAASTSGRRWPRGALACLVEADGVEAFDFGADAAGGRAGRA